VLCFGILHRNVDVDDVVEIDPDGAVITEKQAEVEAVIEFINVSKAFERGTARLAARGTQPLAKLPPSLRL
jgi:hypothetical protein